MNYHILPYSYVGVQGKEERHKKNERSKRKEKREKRKEKIANNLHPRLVAETQCQVVDVTPLRKALVANGTSIFTSANLGPSQLKSLEVMASNLIVYTEPVTNL